MDLATTLTSWAPRMLGILRIVTALLFLEHGTQKLFGFPPLGHAGPELLSKLGAAAMLEAIGGTLLLIGLFTRPVAFILAGEMAIAYWTSHFPRGFFPAVNGGDVAILYCFIFLYLVTAGSGAWAVDRVRGRTRTAKTPDHAGARSRA